MTVQGLSAKALAENGYGRLGFYSSAVMVIVYGFSCFIASPIVKKLGAKACLIITSLTFAIYCSPYILTAYKSEMQPDSWVFSNEFIIPYIYISASLGGFGTALFWASEADYVNDCASKNN